MTEAAVSCVQPAKGPIGATASEGGPIHESQPSNKEGRMSVARVGQKAPDFEAAAFVDGGFKNVRLSDYEGQWVILCFYPGDFTFV